MIDFHTHTSLSFDSESSPQDMLSAAIAKGLHEICFTDHFDYHEYPDGEHFIFTVEDYRKVYDALSSDKILIRRGIEAGLTLWNKERLNDFLNSYPFDYVIGSIHYANGCDPYFKKYWENCTVKEAFESYLLRTLECVKIHDNFDALGHLTYVCKSPNSPTHEPLLYKDFSDIIDEILRVIISKDKALEVNTSGYLAVGEPLPNEDIIKRFKELGGEKIIIGSDAHTPERVGQYQTEVLELIKGYFPYVCSFEKRKPIYHKL